MPVLGHAFVGLGIGMATQPPAPQHRLTSRHAGAAGLWLPAVVTLAYLPDIVGQLGLIAGWGDARLLGHSVVFAIVASPVIAVGLTRLVPVSFARAFVTALVSILVHDILDLAQASDRAPWWPLSYRTFGFDLGLLPTDLRREAMVFAGLLLVFLVLREAFRRWASPDALHPAIPAGGRAPRAWVGRAFICAIVLAAVVTHSLRDARDAQLENGRALIDRRAYRDGLEALAAAERWPATTKPGRIDHLRATAYAGMGDRQRAETYYQRAYQADRTYFWAVADLALLYASSGEPAAERRQAATPYLNRLRTDFAGNPALPTILAQVERKLAARDTSRGAQSGK